ncbi:hypothetical protein BTUL_0149g00230 [Botrytis tulipae]|uniref:Uncharacterized protein n=1 Tax=Botrytis tulipae TaxID=87230 RepID=A0A4Z1EC52_9HELO|nr:hypothetical protein BTUL_0149g00230 [Botrytis tulipae]
MTQCSYEDCSIHNPHNINLFQNSNSPIEVESPLPSSEYLDDISTLDLDDSPPHLSDCDTISTEEEDADSDQGRIEAIAEYHESRDTLMSFDGGSGGSILN